MPILEVVFSDVDKGFEIYKMQLFFLKKINQITQFLYCLCNLKFLLAIIYSNSLKNYHNS